jgi:hypothetical protein
MRRTAATAPARSVAPSMIEASISISPALLNEEPRPALKSGESSSTTTAAATASSAVFPSSKSSYPVSNACFRTARCGAPGRSARSTPAPPWMAIAGFIV